MARVKGKGSGAEMTVRQLVHRMDYSYQLHGGQLPRAARPGVAGRREAIFAHGCF